MRYLKFGGIALLTELLTCWLGRYTFAFENLLYGQSVAYFLVTWYCLDVAADEGASARKTLAAVAAGYLLCVLPIELYDFVGTLEAKFSTMLVLSSMVWGYYCQKYSSRKLAVLACVYLVVMVLWVSPLWVTFCSTIK